MKRFIAVAVFLITACAPGAMTQLTEKEKSIETVIELPGISKEVIYDSSRKWLAETFQSTRAVIDSENRETDTVIDHGIISYPCQGLECAVRGNWKVPFTLTIEAMDDKVRTIFSKVQLSMLPSGRDYSESYNPGRIAPVWRKADMDVIRPVLLKFNRQLKAYITSNH